MNRKVFSVFQVNQYIKAILEEDILLSDIFVDGEISNFKLHGSGHMYFTLKDENAAINCVMFKNYAQALKYMPENGMKVVIYGRVSLYEKTGQYQLYVEFLEPLGKGGLYLAFEQMKEKLAKEGLFDAAYKKEIPPYPQTIAIITSATGAALQDIINVAKRRNKTVELVIVPTLVQGQNAGAEIVAAIRLVNLWNQADTVILARGGGSIEDLWPFNEERVARAIFESEIPVISAVGHETDYTISDFVADLRAPTPSAAAELAVPSLENMRLRVIAANERLYRGLQQKTSYIEQLLRKITSEMLHTLEINRIRLRQVVENVENRSPMAVLRRGYTLVYDEQERLKTSAEQISREEELTIRFHDGSVRVKCERG